MLEEIRRRLAENPFQAFNVVSSSGIKYRIASRDHVSFGPRGTRLVIFFDDDSSVVVSALHITAVEDATSPQPTQPGPTAS